MMSDLISFLIIHFIGVVLCYTMFRWYVKNHCFYEPKDIFIFLTMLALGWLGFFVVCCVILAHYSSEPDK